MEGTPPPTSSGPPDGGTSAAQPFRRGRRGFWERWWKGVLLLVVLVALVAGAVLVGRPLYHVWEHRQAAAMVAEARTHLEAEHWEEASKLLGEAYQKAPDQEDVLRGILELVRRTSPNPERQLFFLKQISAGGHGTLEDRVRMAECHLALRQPAEAQQILVSFTPAEKEGRYGLELQALLARADGQMADSLALLRRSWEAAPEDPECRLRLASLDLKNPFSEIQARSEQTIWDLARGRDRVALLAIEVLAGPADIRFSPAQADELWRLVREHPFASA